MKKFIKYLLYFALPFIILACFFEIYLRQIDTSYTEKEKGIIQNKNKIELLILGNSRATLGIDPNQFDVYAYNIANVAQPLYYDKRLTLKHLDELSNLKYVFITLDMNSLNYSRMGSREIWSYYGNGVEYKDEMSFVSKNFYLKGYSPSIALQILKNDLSGKYKTIKAVDLDEEYELGKPINKGFFSYKNTREEGMTLKFFHSRLDNALANEASSEKEEILADLEDLIKILKAKNITPILVTIPCYEPFIKMFNKEIIKASEVAYENLAKKYDLEYWNYLYLPMEKTDFHDCDHLNIHGAAKFSSVLNSRLNEKIKDTKN